MSFFDDIDDVLDNELSDEIVNKLYGIHKFTEINSIDDFINHIFTVTHLEELVQSIVNTVNKNNITDLENILPDITNYSDNIYEIHFHKNTFSYEYKIKEPYIGFNIVVLFQYQYGRIDISQILLTNVFRSITILERVNIIDIYSNINKDFNKIIETIKVALTYNINKYFSIEIIKFIQRQIDTHGSKEIRMSEFILTHIKSLTEVSIESNYMLDATSNINDKISIIMAYILSDTKLSKYVELISKNNILQHFINYINIDIRQGLSHPYYIILTQLAKHNILDHISIFDFIDGLMYYIKFPIDTK